MTMLAVSKKTELLQPPPPKTMAIAWVRHLAVKKSSTTTTTEKMDGKRKLEGEPMIISRVDMDGYVTAPDLSTHVIRFLIFYVLKQVRNYSVDANGKKSELLQVDLGWRPDKNATKEANNSGKKGQGREKKTSWVASLPKFI